MNLQALARHTVDVDRLPDAPVVLDAGCRGFDFTVEMKQLRPLAKIVPMDPDTEMDGCFTYVRMALVGDDRLYAPYAAHSTGEANFLTEGQPVHYAEIRQVPCVNIEKLMLLCDVTHWDVVKLDIEGSEFSVLENWPGPIADQISVEFHDWTGDCDCTKALERLQSLGYRIVQHELSRQGEGIGHWDSLLVLDK